MPTLKFQAATVDGKPRIYFEKENVKEERRKFDYKTRALRHPLRDHVPVEEEPQANQKPSQPPPKRPPTLAQTRPKGQTLPVKRGPGGKGVGETVTLTQEQLGAILASVGVAAREDGNVKISIDTKDHLVNIAADSPRDYHRTRRRRGSDSDSALGEDSCSEGEGPYRSGDRPRQRQQKSIGVRGQNDRSKRPAEKESVFGLLSKAEGKTAGDRAKQDGKKERFADAKKRGHTRTKDADSDGEDTDAVIRRLIQENQDKMTEEELVDLLAQKYLELKQKNTPREKAMKAQPRRQQHETRGDPRYVEEDGGSTDGEYADRRHRRPRTPEEKKRPGHSKGRRYSVEEDKKERGRQERGHVAHGKTRASPMDPVKKEEEIQVSDQTVMPPPMSISEKKRQQWDRERNELAKLQSYNPWGRPGAGAPPVPSSMEHSPPVPPIGSSRDHKSSDVGGGGGAAYFAGVGDRELEKREADRRRWLADLDAQREERRTRQPDQEPERNTGGPMPYTDRASPRVDDDGMFARGRGLKSLDEITDKDTEDRRRKQIEHQEAIRQQVEEKQRRKMEERERRIREELEEEQKLARERERMQRQFEDESSKQRRKEEASTRRIAVMKETLDAAEEAARLDKYRRRIAQLEQGGHDTSHLRASLEAQLTDRSYVGGAVSVPHLQEIGETGSVVDPQWASPRYRPPPDPTVTDYGGLRLGHNSRMIHPGDSVTEGCQTDTNLLVNLILDGQSPPRHEQPLVPHPVYSHRQQQQSTWPGYAEERPTRRVVTVRSASTEDTRTAPNYDRRVDRGPERRDRSLERISERRSKARDPIKKKVKAPVPIYARPQWNAAKADGKRVLKQSERDPFYQEQQEERRVRRQARESRLLATVQANLDRIPPDDPPKSHRRHLECERPVEQQENLTPRQSGARSRQRSYSPPTSRQYQSTGRYQGHSAPTSPPVPALKNQMHGGGQPPSAMSTAREWDPLVVRTTDVLNPALADRRLPVSREASGREHARKAYLRALNPGQYGDYMENFDDRRVEATLPPKSTKDPIFNPGLMKDRPTPRQEAIMRQLSDIRKGLLQKQKEIETSLSMTEGMA